MSYNRPKIGLGILIINEKGEYLLGKRIDCDLYAIPGGYQEKFETWSEGASRELKEEVGLEIHPKDIFPLIIYNIMSLNENYHNLAIVLVTKIKSTDKIVNMEPDKCKGWEWWSEDKFLKNKEKLFLPNQFLINEYSEKVNFQYLNSFIEYQTNINDDKRLFYSMTNNIK